MADNHHVSIKERIVSCLLNQELASTAEIGKFCGFGDDPNVYQHVSRQLKALVGDGTIEYILKYRRPGSKSRRGTAYRLNHSLIVVSRLYSDPDFVKIQPMFRRSPWIRQAIIRQKVRGEGREINPELVMTCLEISPSFFELCLRREISIFTTIMWGRPLGFGNWLHTGLDRSAPRDRVSQDILVLEILRLCLYRDWINDYPEGEFPRQLVDLIHQINLFETNEFSRVLRSAQGVLVADACVQVIKFFRGENFEAIDGLNSLLLQYVQAYQNFADRSPDQSDASNSELLEVLRSIPPYLDITPSGEETDGFPPLLKYLKNFPEQRGHEPLKTVEAAGSS